MQGHGFARARGARNQAVAVGFVQLQGAAAVGILGKSEFSHGIYFSKWGATPAGGGNTISDYTETPHPTTAKEFTIMAGHSKWANIQHRKGRQDEKRGKIWTRITREIIVAARAGGGDIHMNPRLRLAIDKAKAANMPADNIKRNVDKATGNLDGVTYEEIRYEGYGLGGAAIMVDTMTDNKVRTVAEVRHAFSKCGGNLGTDGSVAYQFKHVGQILLAPGVNEDKVMEVALEAGAEDVIADEEGGIEVLTAPADFEAVRDALERAGLKAEVAEITMRADVPVALAGDDAVRMQKLLDMLEDLDDTQDVYHNAELDLPE